MAVSGGAGEDAVVDFQVPDDRFLHKRRPPLLGRDVLKAFMVLLTSGSLPAYPVTSVLQSF
jgi:hypothetical protein